MKLTSNYHVITTTRVDFLLAEDVREGSEKYLTIYIYVYYTHMGERTLQIDSVDSAYGSIEQEAFLRDAKTGLLLAHAGYKFSGKRNEWYEKVAYLNTLSSLSGAMKQRIRTILGGKEADRYNPEVLPEDLVCNIGRPGMELVRRLVSEILPNDIIFLRIPVAEKAEQKLNRYYWQVGGELKSNDMIRAVSNYSDGVCYQIRPI